MKAYKSFGVSLAVLALQSVRKEVTILFNIRWLFALYSHTVYVSTVSTTCLPVSVSYDCVCNNVCKEKVNLITLVYFIQYYMFHFITVKYKINRNCACVCVCPINTLYHIPYI